MKYQAPFGSSDPNAPYVDRNTAGATSGSKLPGKAIEQPMRELVALQTLCGLTASDADLQQVAKAIQSGKLNYAVATGSANAWVVAPALALDAYAAGRVLWIKCPATNTNTVVTVNISTLGTRPLKKSDGSAPAAGDLVANRWYPTIDDGTNICVVARLGSDAIPSAIINAGAVKYFRTPGATAYVPGAGIIGVRVQVWGAGGSGGVSPSTAGNAGGSSSFGTFITALGGGGAFSNRIGGDGGGSSFSADVGNSVPVNGTPGANGNDGGTGGYPGGAGGAAFGGAGGAGGGGTNNANGTPLRSGTYGVPGMFPGGGGGGQGTNGSSGGVASAGGGGGGYAEGWIPASKLPASVTVTVGTGGAAPTSLAGAGANGCVIVTEVY